MLPADMDNVDRVAPIKRIVHVHIPKTAGMALSEAFQRAYGERLRVYPERFEVSFAPIRYSDFDFYTGHIGFKIASEIGGDLITVLREPVDRFLSTYYYLRQLYNTGAELTHKASLTARYDIDQFVQIKDEPVLDQEFRNRMTWQIAYSHRLELRKELAETGVDDYGVVQIAISNLSKFAIVGIHDDMDELADAVAKRFGVRLRIGRVNVTQSRAAPKDISVETLRRLESWINLDQEMYRTWTAMHPPLVGGTRIPETS